ncbi:hypothetical protein Y032_0124g1209 [Ancylostoma ceylanicum]|nr:hypothetical protein Y032_0124g1209 [Ancylostoma ceylanicum]
MSDPCRDLEKGVANVFSATTSPSNLWTNNGLHGGDLSAVSKSTRRGRTARAGILSGTTNYGDFLIIHHCGNDSIVSGAVASRAFRGCLKASAIDSHCMCALSDSIADLSLETSLHDAVKKKENI